MPHLLVINPNTSTQVTQALLQHLGDGLPRWTLHGATAAWGAPYIADERGYWVCNSIWMLDDFTEENGATRVLPGSHTWRRLPEAGNTGALPGEVLVTGKAGTVGIMNTHMWHGGTANRTDRCRRALHAFYTRDDKPQQQYQKGMLRPSTVDALTPLQRRVLAIDDAENDRLSTATTRMSGFLK